jgi:hypothetical protein
MPYVQVIESFREFAQRHGNQSLNCDGLIVFPDGASANADDGNYRSEPPADPVELLRMKLRFWRQAVKVSEKDFTSTRAQFVQQAQFAMRYGNLPGPGSDAVDYLNEIAAAVRRARDEVAKLEKELAENSGDDLEYRRRQFRIQHEQEEQRRAAQLLQEIESVVI